MEVVPPRYSRLRGAGTYLSLPERMLSDDAILGWLSGEGRKVPFQFPPEKERVFPFDFLKLEPGPMQTDLQGSDAFRKSLFAVSHIQGFWWYGSLLVTDGGEIRRDPVAAGYDPETGDVCCLIGKEEPDSDLRVTVMNRKDNFEVAHVFSFRASTESQGYELTYRFAIDRDCDFCVKRECVCMCNPEMKSRMRLGRLPEVRRHIHSLGERWNVSCTAIRICSGNSWFGVNNGPRMRTRLRTDVTLAYDRVQQIMTANTSWKKPAPVDETRLLDLPPNSPLESGGSSGGSPAPRRPKKHQCPTCDATFRSRHHMLRHSSAVHKKEKNFTCPVCAKTFSQKSHLTAHVTNMHENCTKMQCELCGATFGWRSNYLKHVRVKHPGR